MKRNIVQASIFILILTIILSASSDFSFAEEIVTTSYAEKDQQGHDVNFRMKSYFYKILNFEYDSKEKMVTFEIPFDWSEKTISDISLVHEEVHFPKDFAEFLNPSYTAHVNDVKLSKSSIIVDDATDEDYRIVHFMLFSDNLKFLNNEQKKAGIDLPDKMVFTLTYSDLIEFPIIAMTENEELRVDLSWDPPIIEPDKNTKFIFTIRDPVTLGPLRQSSYDFVLIQNGEEIHRTSGVAVIGGGFEDYTFSEDSAGPVSVRLENIRGTGESTEIVVQVVPEFGPIALIILAVSIISVIVVNAKSKTIPRF